MFNIIYIAPCIQLPSYELFLILTIQLGDNFLDHHCILDRFWSALHLDSFFDGNCTHFVVETTQQQFSSKFRFYQCCDKPKMYFPSQLLVYQLRAQIRVAININQSFSTPHYTLRPPVLPCIWLRLTAAVQNTVAASTVRQELHLVTSDFILPA